MGARSENPASLDTRCSRPAPSDDVYERIFDGALDAILLVDAQSGEIVRVNRAVDGFLGYTPARLVGEHLSIVFPAGRRNHVAELLSAGCEAAPALERWTVQRADGVLLGVEIAVSHLPSTDAPLIALTLRDDSERLQAEEALRRSEERLELVLRGADLGLWDWNIETNEIVFNQRAAEMVGYEASELEPHTRIWRLLVHPDDKERVQALMRAHVAGETPYYESEHRLRTKSGEWVWVLNRGKVVRRDARGRALRASGTQFDISDRKRGEEERAALLEMAKELSGTLDFEELVASVERRTAQVLPAETVGTFYWDTECEGYRLISQYGLPDATVAAMQPVLFPLGAVFGGRLAAGETLVVDRMEDWGPRERAALGRFGLVAFAAVPLVIRGQVRGVFVVGSRMGTFSPRRVRFLEAIARQLAVAIESAALHRAQQAETRHSMALARVGQELISSLATPGVYGDLCRVTSAVLGSDVSSLFLWSAREGAYVPQASHGETPERWEALRVMRLTPAMTATLLGSFAPTGLVRLDRLPEDDPVRRSITNAHRLTAGIFVALRRGRDIVGFQCAGVRGEEATFSAHQERVARGIAQIASLALESARLVGELERAGRIKSDFVATMSHELRTPLNVIIGYHDLLLEGEFGSLTTAQAERLRRADQSARELLDLINATLDLSRLEARQMGLQLEDIDLATVVDELDAEIATVRRKPTVHFGWQLPAELPAVRTDAVKLKVVLKNLIHNAIKFTDVGEVTVGVRSSPGRIEFEVIDTGIGIAPELQSAIFEPFRQVDSSSTRSYGGVGLGLYIVQRLLDLLGGGIAVESEAGRGSRFSFWLPAEP
jgi:PAS domain S-box-containing protein